MKPVLVVGPGRAGGCLARLHAAAGDAVELLGRRPGPWQARARRAGIQPRLAPPDELAPATVILAVPDAGLAAAARALAGALAPDPRRLVVHLSGLHGLAPLAPFRRRGERVAALHPILPFPEAGADATALDGVVVTVSSDGGPGHARAARVLARSWGGRPRAFPPDADRRRYHLGLALAANHLTALIGWSEELLAPALGGRGRELAIDLAEMALARCRADGPGRALTGPVARGDLETVRAHLRALRGRERRRYLGQLEAVVHLAERSGRIGAAEARALRELADG